MDHAIQYNRHLVRNSQWSLLQMNSIVYEYRLSLISNTAPWDRSSLQVLVCALEYTGRDNDPCLMGFGTHGNQVVIDCKRPY